MKQSTFVALVLMLAAAVGALTAAWLYVRRREKELDEYEQLLFSEDFSDDEHRKLIERYVKEAGSLNG